MVREHRYSHRSWRPAMKRVLLLALGFGVLAVPPAASPNEAQLIPRSNLFVNPEKTSPQLSPDGKHIAYLAPDDKNVLQVWVRTLGKDDDQKITNDPKRGIRQYQWAFDNE